MDILKKYEVIIIGGSYAGLSAAMSLGRALRNVLIIDSSDACNKQTPHSHNFITQDGNKPAEISEKAKKQVLNYSTIEFLNDFVVSIEKKENFIIKSSNEIFEAEYLILATGVKDIMPNIPGFSECWGISVIHCPYCHGYEVKEQKTGFIEINFSFSKSL